jgi:tRNA U34 5-methylaminomethyl-2-thiouridine-forming methyltransferase MnmC
MEDPEIRITGDGSPTLFSPRYQATYHSLHGALRESQHVFIHAGLHHRLQYPFTPPVRIFEMGFGTGINAFLSWCEAENWGLSLEYTALERHPLPEAIWQALPRGEGLQDEAPVVFDHLHAAPWGVNSSLSPHFRIQKLEACLETASLQGPYDVIFYDAFGPGTQPALWTTEILLKVCNELEVGGVFVTYCAKGEVRRTLQHLGLVVERLPGPPGKREMLRASRPASDTAQLMNP